MKRLSLIAGSLLAGTLAGAYFLYPERIASLWMNVLGFEIQAKPVVTPHDDDHDHDHNHDHDHDHDHGHEHEKKSPDAEGEAAHGEESQKLSIAAEEIDRSKIVIEPVQSGILQAHLRIPGTIIPDRNRVGRVPSKVVGTVAILKKGLGDSVQAGEVIAILDSREVADAKSEYIAASVNFELQETLHQREKTLWDKRVSSEQRLLRADATFREAQVRRDGAKQKLLALGVSEESAAKLVISGHQPSGLERYEIKAPISGRIVEQLVDIGTPMGGEGQVHELYAIADLSTVWVELTISPQDLPAIKEGQQLTIDGPTKSDGKIIFISPILNQDTRSARVIASLDNRDGTWRPGTFVNADIALSASKADLVIPKSALQTIEGEPRVFVRTPDGFESRRITIGTDDGQAIEVLDGLKAGEPIAVANTFLLKAELGKSEAEHNH